jgi:hypothetical protein
VDGEAKRIVGDDGITNAYLSRAYLLHPVYLGFALGAISETDFPNPLTTPWCAKGTRYHD